MRGFLLGLLSLALAAMLFLSLGWLYPSKNYTAEVEVFKEPAICWYFYTKPDLMKLWMDRVVNVKLIPDDQDLDSIIMEVETDMGEFQTLRLDVTSMDRPKLLTYSYIDDIAQHDITMRFLRTDLGTRIVQQHVYTFQNPLTASLMHLMNTDVKSRAEDQLKSLKRIIEDEYPPNMDYSPQITTPSIEALDSTVIAN